MDFGPSNFNRLAGAEVTGAKALAIMAAGGARADDFGEGWDMSAAGDFEACAEVVPEFDAVLASPLSPRTSAIPAVDPGPSPERLLHSCGDHRLNGYVGRRTANSN